MEDTNTTKQPKIELIEKVPENILSDALDIYKTITEMTAYVKIPFAVIAVIFLIHNIFIAGKSYAIDTYNNILHTELAIVGIIAVVVFIIAGITIKNNIKLKKTLTEISKRYHINISKTQEEFNTIAVTIYGGNGFTFKA